ncbi:MAG: ribosome maturation factor RimP [Burkholderiaceae bacterium]|nr:ribosome maturation factor RimP [Burkholderiaceae bacterium]
MSWQLAVERTVTGMGYELVDCGRSAGGLLSVFIDRLPGRQYPSGEGEHVTVDDCELVTRQLQYVLEVEGCEYARLEVSSPGLDRPLRKEADFVRFAGAEIELTLKRPFQGRKKYRGVLQQVSVEAGAEAGSPAAAPGFELVFRDGQEDKVLGFVLDEVRETRLVPVVDFKRGRRRPDAQAAADQAGLPSAHGSKESGGHEE